MRRCWLLLLLLASVGCSGSAPTQTRTAELAQLAQAGATQTRAAELVRLTQVAATAAVFVPSPTPTPAPTATPGSAGPTPTAAAPGARCPLPPGPRGPLTTVTWTPPGAPAFSDLVLDEARGRLYGADSLGGRILALSLPGLEVAGTVELGQTSQPAGMALSPDGAELAVALFGAGNIALVDRAP
jgi:DNA-binding beta-propeller fold protein YncE